MRSFATILLIFVFTLGAFAQNDQPLSKRELKKLQKEQKKAEAAAQMEAQLILTTALVEGQRFVLEADFLSDQKGSRIPVQSTINFIAVDSNRSTLQFGSANMVGVNGVGGATLEGNIGNYQYATVGKQKNNFNVTFNVMTSLGTFDFSLMIGPDGRADATVRGNWGGQLNYHGKLIPVEVSRVYKGMPVY
jgi:hypothetical protein